MRPTRGRFRPITAVGSRRPRREHAHAAISAVARGRGTSRVRAGRRDAGGPAAVPGRLLSGGKRIVHDTAHAVFSIFTFRFLLPMLRVRVFQESRRSERSVQAWKLEHALQNRWTRTPRCLGPVSGLLMKQK